MQKECDTIEQTFGEEIANVITHGIGLLLSLGGFVVLTTFAYLHGNVWHVVSCSVFGATLVILYGASTFYHGAKHKPAKSALQVMDHIAIFLLIAGSYTPFMLVNLRGPWGWSLFGVIWGLAFIGVMAQVLKPRRWELFRVSLYVAMGWIVLIAGKALFASVAPGGLWLLALGGLAYTFGIIFYAWDKLPYNHAVWHVFVLVGSTLHFFAVLFYVIPASTT